MWCSPLSHRIVLTPQVSNLCNTGEKNSHYWDIISSSQSRPLHPHLGCQLLQSPSRRSPLSPIHSLLPHYLLLTWWAFQASTAPRNHGAQQASVALSALQLARSPSTRILSCSENKQTPMKQTMSPHPSVQGSLKSPSPWPTGMVFLVQRIGPWWNRGVGCRAHQEQSTKNNFCQINESFIAVSPGGRDDELCHGYSNTV